MIQSVKVKNLSLSKDNVRKSSRETGIDALLDAFPARVHQRGDRAFYDRVADSITMPPVALFSTRAYFASTLAHEAGHWTATLTGSTESLAGNSATTPMRSKSFAPR